MRTKGSREQLEYLRQADRRNHIGTVLKGLDVLGSTPWRINRPVFETILKAWNTGQSFPSIPPLRTKPEPIPKPDDYSSNYKTRKEWKQKTKVQTTEYRNDHSLRCDVNYKIEISRAVPLLN